MLHHITHITRLRFQVAKLMDALLRLLISINASSPVFIFWGRKERSVSRLLLILQPPLLPPRAEHVEESRVGPVEELKDADDTGSSKQAQSPAWKSFKIGLRIELR